MFHFHFRRNIFPIKVIKYALDNFVAIFLTYVCHSHLLYCNIPISFMEAISSKYIIIAAPKYETCSCLQFPNFVYVSCQVVAIKLTLQLIPKSQN